jgi:hypothetical protein
MRALFFSVGHGFLCEEENIMQGRVLDACGPKTRGKNICVRDRGLPVQHWPLLSYEEPGAVVPRGDYGAAHGYSGSSAIHALKAHLSTTRFQKEAGRECFILSFKRPVVI